MGTEIERKFLIDKMPDLPSNTGSNKIVQGYLSRSMDGATVRVRQLGEADKAGSAGYITIKGKKIGLVQPEHEYEIPVGEAVELFKLCEPGLLEKTRYYIPHGDFTIELDVFEGKNKGLIIAEIELSSEDDNVEIPDWFGKEVSYDSNYSNAALSRI